MSIAAPSSGLCAHFKKKGLVVRQPTSAVGEGTAVRRFDPSGLVLTQQKFAIEYGAYGQPEQPNSEAGTRGNQ